MKKRYLVAMGLSTLLICGFVLADSKKPEPTAVSEITLEKKIENAKTNHQALLNEFKTGQDKASQMQKELMALRDRIIESAGAVRSLEEWKKLQKKEVLI